MTFGEFALKIFDQARHLTVVAQSPVVVVLVGIVGAPRHHGVLGHRVESRRNGQRFKKGGSLEFQVV